MIADTLANEIYIGGSVLVSWLIMGRTMMKKPASDPWAIALVVSCMVGIAYALYVLMTWMPESTFCASHCFPWGN
jgi:hypothetical protein